MLEVVGESDHVMPEERSHNRCDVIHLVKGYASLAHALTLLGSLNMWSYVKQTVAREAQWIYHHR